MNHQDLAVIILSIAGAIVQLVVRLTPKIWNWYSKQENKGLLMFALLVIISGAYFGISCTPLASDLQIQVACTTVGAIEMLRALFYMAGTQTMTYLYTKNVKLSA